MNCCDTLKYLRLYRSHARTGQTAYCIKCGRTHTATSQEIDRILTQGGADD